MRLFELPCEGWQGWHMHSGKLWTPEGFGFTPDCQSWWSLLVRQARLFRQMADRERQLDIAMQSTLHGSVRMTQTGPATQAERGAGPVASGAPSGAAGRAAKPTGPNLLLEHFRKSRLTANEINDLGLLAKLVSTLNQGETHVHG